IKGKIIKEKMTKNIILISLLAISLLAASSYFVATHKGEVETQESNNCWSINALPGSLFVTNVCGENYIFNASFNCHGQKTELQSQCVSSNSSGQLNSTTSFSINECRFVSMEQLSC
ncbi:transmembrane protein, putative, partial (macronuclear) [Tetrahymena thermophila SB210]